MKMYLSTTKEPIEFGDTIVLENEFTHEYFGNVTSKTEVLVTEHTYKSLVKEGILIIENDIEIDYNTIRSTVISRMSKRYGWDEKRLVRILNTLDEVHPSAAVQMTLKEIALMLDEKYPGYIGKSEEMYVISMGDGNIYPINKDNIKSFRNIAVFRTVGDAELAKNILGDKLTNLF
jgi:hypothetical protein